MSDDSSKGSPEAEEGKEEGEEQGEGIQKSGEEPKETLTCELQPERQPQAELEDGDREAEIQGGDQRREEREVRKEEKDPGTSVQAKREERMKRLRELHLRRNEARKLNHAEVVEEDRRNKLPANWEARKRKAEWEANEEEARKQAEEAGEDYERVKLLETSASEIDRLERKKKKKNPDTGFADFEQAQLRQYQRLTRQMEPNMEEYERQKEEMGADFYPGVNSLGYGGKGKVSKAGIDRMVADLDKQIEKRSKFSRRRAFNEEADVDYINERNMKFNKKAARFYDKYTAEIKQNLERGTAV